MISFLALFVYIYSDLIMVSSTQGFKDRKEPYFVTHGVNMMEVMACPDVDFTRTTCNDLIEVCVYVCMYVRMYVCKIITTAAQTPFMFPDSRTYLRTYTHRQIFESLGIEAARSGMLNEIRSVLFFDGGYINYRHMSILVDVMTFRGALTAVSRHGINRGEQVCRLGGLYVCMYV